MSDRLLEPQMMAGGGGVDRQTQTPEWGSSSCPRKGTGDLVLLWTSWLLDFLLFSFLFFGGCGQNLRTGLRHKYFAFLARSSLKKQFFFNCTYTPEKKTNCLAGICKTPKRLPLVLYSIIKHQMAIKSNMKSTLQSSVKVFSHLSYYSYFLKLFVS